MSAAYPPVGTRVRWTSSGRTREGVVIVLVGRKVWQRGAARGECAFIPGEAWRRNAPNSDRLEVVQVDTVDGQPNTGRCRYYHPRASWLEVVEPPGEGS